MFRLTSATRGGLLLMLMFFYSAFILGTATFIETGGRFENCTTRAQCVYILMRLTFYDGDGFNFIFGLTDRHRFLFLITILYLCITGFGIMNGLVGIFGTAFSGASDEAFADKPQDSDTGNDGEGNGDQENGYGEGKQARTQKLAARVFRSFRGDPDPDDEGSGDEDQEVEEGGDGGRDGAEGARTLGLKPSEMVAPGGRAANPPNLESWSSDEEAGVGQGKPPAGPAGAEVWPFDAPEYGALDTKPTQIARQQSNKMSTGAAQRRQDVLQEQIDTLTPSDKLAMQRQLAGKLGAKSQFALAELKRIAAVDAASPPAPTLRKGNSLKSAAITSKPTEFTRTGTAGKVVPVHRYAASSGEEEEVGGVASPRQQRGQGASATNHTAAEGVEQHHDEARSHAHHQRPSGGAAHAGGMFKRQASNKSIATSDGHTNHLNYVKTNPFAASLQSKHTNVTGHAQQALEIRSLTLNVQALTRKMEAQSELIAAMYRHMQLMGHGRDSSPSHNVNAGVVLGAGAHAQHGIVHTLHAVQHAVQDSLGSILHPHHAQQPHDVVHTSALPGHADDPAGSATAPVSKVRTLPPLDTSISRPGALSPSMPSQTPQTAAPTAAPTPGGPGAQEPSVQIDDGMGEL
jgi:hypothetical protein